MADWIKFLGTAGGRFVMTAQRRHSGGLWLHLGEQNLLLDPGPGSLVRAWASRPPLDPGQLDGVLISHHHIDHATDANVMIEAMTEGGHRQRGLLLAPQETLTGDSPLCRYVQEFPARVETLQEGSTHQVGPVTVTGVHHHHSAETYGMIFTSPGGRWGYLVDTGYFAELAEAYADLDLLVISTVLWENPRGLLHLTVADGVEIIRRAQPRRAVLTSFGMSVLNHRPWELAEGLSQELGIEVIAASDGMTVHVGGE